MRISSVFRSVKFVSLRTISQLFFLVPPFLIVVAFFIGQNLIAQEFPVESYSTQNGLPHNNVQCVRQDRNGLMWFSTQFGVVSYDGHYWTNIHYPDLNILGYHNSIYFDKNNHLWLVTQSKEVATWDGKQWEILYGNKKGIIGFQNSSKIIYEDNRGVNIAFYSRGKLFLFDGAEWEEILPPGRHKQIHNIIVVEGVLHVLVDNRLYKYVDGMFADSQYNNIDFSTPVLTFFSEGSSDTTNVKLWYLNENQVGYIENGEKVLLANISPKVINSLKDSSPLLLPDGFGGVWIGSSRDLIHYGVDGVASPYDALGGLGAQGVTSLIRDRENSVWVSSTRGVKRVLSYSFLNYKRTNGLLQNEVTALCYLNNGKVVCGHSKGLSIISDNGIEKVHLPNFFSSTSNINVRIMDILPDSRQEGALCLTTDVVGLIHMDANKKFRRIKAVGSNYSLSTMIQYDKNTLYIGYGGGILAFDINNEKLTEIKPEKDTFTRYVYRKDNNIYLGTVKDGLVKYDGKDFTFFKFNNFFANSIYTVSEYKGTIFVGTKAGLYFLDKNFLKKYLVGNSTIDDPIYLLIENEDELWAGGNNGVYQVKDNILKKYTTANGFVGTETNRKAGLVTPDGDVWIGTVEGLSRYTGDNDQMASDTVLPKLRSISIDDELVDSSNDINIPYDNNNLIFTIEYLSYRNENEVLFEYRLVNNNTKHENTFVSETREVYYPNLQPGEYQLKVRAKNGIHPWGQSVTVSTFKVNKPFSKTIWFYLLINFITLGVLALIVFLFMQKRRVSRLSGKVASAQERIETIVTSSNTILLQLDNDSRVKFISPREVGTQEHGFETIENKVLEKFVDPEDHKVSKQIRDRLLKGEITKEENYQIRLMPNGKDPEWYHLSVSPIMENGTNKGINVIAKNINEMKLLEEQLLHAQKLEAIGQLAGSIAHDFNNLLTAIQGYNELARNEETSIDLIHNYLDELDENVDRATNLTQKLLAFSRKQKQNLEYLNLNDVVANLIKMLKRLIGEVNLSVDFDEDIGVIKTDVGQLEQVIVNLVVNARDAVGPNGAIHITTGEHVETLENGMKKDWVRLSISDNGSGIPEEIQDKLFEPFFTTKSAGKGTGLGLSTVYGIINQSGGRLHFETKQGVGTTFHVDFPKSNYIGDFGEKTSSRDDEKTLHGNESILVVEDEESVSEYTAVALTKYGYKVDIIPSGEKILNDVNCTEEFDMLLIDIILPGISGSELAKIVRKNDDAKKIVYMSGYGEDYLSKQGFDLSDAPLIKKPFKSSQLLRTIRNILDA